jgi:hypothetical protein
MPTTCTHLRDEDNEYRLAMIKELRRIAGLLEKNEKTGPFAFVVDQLANDDPNKIDSKAWLVFTPQEAEGLYNRLKTSANKIVEAIHGMMMEDIMEKAILNLLNPFGQRKN